MRIKELHEILQLKKKGKVTQNDIARAIGTSRANVSKLFSKNSFINDEKIKKIEKYFDVSFENIKDDFVIDYYPDSPFEIINNQIKISEKKVKFHLPFGLFNVNKNFKYIMTNAIDDSMLPNLKKDDFVIIELSDNQNIVNNKIHAFIYEDCFYIRRLSKNINQIIVQSDNETYPVQYIKKEDFSKLYIVGQAVYMIRTEI